MGRYTEAYWSRIRDVFNKLGETPSNDEIGSLLRWLARWRSELLANTYVAHHGTTIMGGPFAGMDYVVRTAEGPRLPRLLGTYEAELHSCLEGFISGQIDTVIDVGCSDGYYAVGLARRMPGARIYAYDIDPNALEKCQDLAERNGVSGRVTLGRKFEPEDFQAFAGKNALVIVDTEGAEIEILQPALSPALSNFNIIVETHSTLAGFTTDIIRSRFSSTHNIVQLEVGLRMCALPDWLTKLRHLDQLLAVWEWRSTPTPWLIMSPNATTDTATHERS